MQHTPPTTSTVRSKGALLAFVVGGLVVGGFLTAGLATVCAPLAIVPILLVLLGLYALVRQHFETSQLSHFPLERIALLILDERTRIADRSGGGVLTRYFHTVEYRDGTRRELETFVETAGKVSPGNMGIGFIRGSLLVDFAHLSV